MSSLVRLITTLATLLATAVTVWLGGRSDQAPSLGPVTLTAPRTAFAGQEITVSGHNYWQCLYGPPPTPGE